MLSGHGLSSAVSRQDLTCSGYQATSKNPEVLPTSNIATAFSNNLKSYTLSDLKNATKNLLSDSLIGERGFGYVFKGWIDKNTLTPAKPGTGMVVAIKKLKKESFQGHKEWLAEVNYLGQLHHENLVELIGYCSEAENRLLVYEFLLKGSLENHLFRKGVEPLDWPTRMNIAIGVTRGLSFLHSRDANVIYRDLKAANILLDSMATCRSKGKKKNVRRTVLSSVVGTLDLSIRQYLYGETYPGGIECVTQILAISSGIFSHKEETRRIFAVFAHEEPFDAHKYAYIANVCVSKFARCQGVRTNMIYLATDVTNLDGMKQSFVHVCADNIAARKLYQKTGVKIVEATSPIMSEDQRLMLEL